MPFFCIPAVVICAIILPALPLFARDRATLDLAGTLVTLQDSAHPTAFAEIVMQNEPVNGAGDNGEHILILRDFPVVVEFVWNRGPAGEDAIIVTPPDGVICDPGTCVLELPENETGTLYLFRWEGM